MNRLLAVTIICLAIGGCKKDPERCWECKYSFYGKQPEKTGDTVLCNFNETDIRLREDIELDGTYAGYEKWKLTNCKERLQ